MKKKNDVLNDDEAYYMKKKGSNEQKEGKNKKTSGKTKAIIALSITTGVLALTTVGFGIGYGITQSQAINYGNRLENVYQKSFYDLVDSVNNTEIKLSKILNSSGSTYQRKLLNEVSQNATTAEANISSLPLSQGDINDNVRMVNQISGYTSTLAEKLASGEKLSQGELETLEEVYQNILTMKTQLNKIARRIQNGYNILDNSMNLDAKSSDFSLQMATLHDINTEYPTMIYDGPFSDSVTNSEVKGLKGEKISKDEAREVVNKTFKNVVSLYFDAETNGRFETYNFRLKNSDEEMLYVQVSKIGGNILTVSGAGKDEHGQHITEEDAEKIAIQFAKDNGIVNPQVVWQDTITNDIYFNIAPISNGIILYPDLIKVKVDLGTGTVVGYDATTYFTNHINRNLPASKIDIESLKSKIPNTLTIVNQRTVLAPLDYNREVLCHEFECVNSDDTFYFYFNAVSGEEENILKVIKTDDGSKLL